MPPALLALAVVPQVLGMVQQGVMMHQMQGQNDKNQEAMMAMLKGGQNAQAGIGGVTGAPVDGAQGYQQLA